MSDLLGSCRPWERKDFFARVETYSVSKWFGKGHCIGPLECARFGWICVAEDVLGCTLCEARLNFMTPPTMNYSGVLAMEKTWLRELETLHEPSCQWADNPSPTRFCHLSSNSHELEVQFKELYDSWHTDLFGEEKSSPDVPVVDSDTLMKWKAVTNEARSNAALTMNVPSVLASFGWEKSVQNAYPQDDIVTADCKYCSRHVLIRSFLTSEQGAQSVSSCSGDAEAPKPVLNMFLSPSKRRKTSLFSAKLSKPALSTRSFGIWHSANSENKSAEPFQWPPPPSRLSPNSSTSMSHSSSNTSKYETPPKQTPPLPASASTSSPSKLDIPLSQLQEGKIFPYKVGKSPSTGNKRDHPNEGVEYQTRKKKRVGVPKETEEKTVTETWKGDLKSKDTSTSFDPEKEHRYFCPYKNQVLSDGKADKNTVYKTLDVGWVYVMKTVSKKRHIRSQLEESNANGN